MSLTLKGIELKPGQLWLINGEVEHVLNVSNRSFEAIRRYWNDCELDGVDATLLHQNPIELAEKDKVEIPLTVELPKQGSLMAFELNNELGTISVLVDSVSGSIKTINLSGNFDKETIDVFLDRCVNFVSE